MTLAERQREWHRRWRDDGDEEARLALIESCVGMVYKCVLGLSWAGNRDDIVAEGKLALVEAVETYDPSRGTFAACAHYAIKNRLMEMTRTSGHAAVAARSRPERRLRYHLGRKVGEHESAGFGRNRAIELAARDLGVSPEHAAAALAVRTTESLDAGGEEGGLVDDAPTAAEIFDQERVRQVIADAMSGLDEIERRVIVETMIAARPRTLKDIAPELGLTSRRVGQLREDALQHVRFELRRRGLGLNDMLA